MTDLTSFIAPETLRTLGWSLLHFVWQGFALAAIASIALTLFRRASARYIVGVLTLLAMVTSVAITFMLLLNSQSAMQATENAATPVLVFAQKAIIGHAAQPAASGVSAAKSLSAQALPLLVEFWLAGVLFFALRTAGGLLYLERLRRAASVSVAPALLAKCRELQSRLGITRIIRFCECRWLDAPAVIGWFKPVVLLPVRALTGLTEDQIEAVIAHELAHVRRFDAFVNLFQVFVEAVLFFHPAVWWLNKRVRAERENCCDDIAVAACGNHLGYARALTTMEEWRATPSFSLAANGSPLAARISRILGLRHASETRAAGLGAGFVCFGAAVIAASLLYGVSHPAAAARIKTAIVSSWADDSYADSAAPAPKPRPTAGAHPNAFAMPALPQDAKSSSPKSSYIDEMKSAGLDNLDVDKLIALKVQDVTAEYVRGLRAAGFNPSVDEIIAMKVQDISPAYIKSIRDMGFAPNLNEVIGMKVQDVTPEYIKSIKDAGYTPDLNEIIGMKVQDISPAYIKQMRDLGFQPSLNQLIGMKVQDVTPEYVKKMRDLGIQPNADQIIGMKVQDVTPEYVQQMRAIFPDLSADKVIGMKVQDITPEYVKQLSAAGFSKLTADQVIGAKVMDITPEFIKEAEKHGFKNLTLDKLIQLKNADVL
ncbi:MAG TPA: M56 family metallopeptidase [Candidatus Acidoferrum sp.]|nr:M56 family metallopeptidase [Candidatus Acidoferrum sp.]